MRLCCKCLAHAWFNDARPLFAGETLALRHGPARVTYESKGDWQARRA